jgi:hypothetical protein
MLIDDFLPSYDFVETHEISINSKPDDVYSSLNEVNYCGSPIIRWLFWLRGLPAENVTLQSLSELRFITLGEVVNEEILLGITGQFWTVNGNLKKLDASGFREFNEKGFAKAVWNFSLNWSGLVTFLTTETRIKCLDPESRRRFGLYWTFISPFSGLIRMEMLKLVKRQAERLAHEKTDSWRRLAKLGQFSEAEDLMLADTGEIGEQGPDAETRAYFYEDWGDALRNDAAAEAKYREAHHYWAIFASWATSGGEGTARMGDANRVLEKLENLRNESKDCG